MEQDLAKLDPSKLNPLSPEVISRQATINIGTIGHVAHGKSTVVKAISGVQTVRLLTAPPFYGVGCVVGGAAGGRKRGVSALGCHQLPQRSFTRRLTQRAI